ncbi:hypothetical protein CY34DRAFT_15701 [Suillus luteus UH-Slu-Lm8-n1]|uniref:Uncharacterized protein n=1 Tax=Suillus luteus UH-Slu-Lm8-n1 TaxID=930992 RepID=A0A0D0AT50_9AGAM|nr:hypothetical protein CY34DRAFT_15701 [Suillus luteus UH-Slu-Lm8-n1]
MPHTQEPLPEPFGTFSHEPIAASPPLPCTCSCHDQQVTLYWSLYALTQHLSVQQLQTQTPYGAMPSEVQVQVQQTINVAQSEYMHAMHLLFEEYYIASPLDDGHLILVGQFKPEIL